MCLFYAYLKHNQSNDGRYLITFVDREAADEWWRMISTSPSPFVGQVKRISPQLYTQTLTKSNVATMFFTCPELPRARDFFEKMFFTHLSDNNTPTLCVAPAIKMTDHVSGKLYFIRSQSDPTRYWYFSGNDTCMICKAVGCKAIHVSTARRSMFHIQVHNPPTEFQSSKDLIMIGRDIVSIMWKDFTLCVNEAQRLIAKKLHGSHSPGLPLCDLKSIFATIVERNAGEIQEVIMLVDRGLGEAWELAD